MRNPTMSLPASLKRELSLGTSSNSALESVESGPANPKIVALLAAFLALSLGSTCNSGSDSVELGSLESCPFNSKIVALLAALLALSLGLVGVLLGLLEIYNLLNFSLIKSVTSGAPSTSCSETSLLLISSTVTPCF